MAAVNPLNDPDDFIDERQCQRLTPTYAATIVLDDEDALFPLPLRIGFPANPGPPPSPASQVVNAACAVERATRPSLLGGPSSFGMFVSC